MIDVTIVGLGPCRNGTRNVAVGPTVANHHAVAVANVLVVVTQCLLRRSAPRDRREQDQSRTEPHVHVEPLYLRLRP